MEEILKQLFGGAVTEDILKKFKTELGTRFVAKTDYNARLEEIKTLKADKLDLESKITTLTENSKNTEDFKQKFEDLQKEIKEKEEKAEQDRIAKERADGIANRFNAVVGDKKFNHDAIRADYLKKFGEALENKDFEGKSDTEIFHELTKDDATAFVGVTTLNLKGGSSQVIDGMPSNLGDLNMADYIAARKQMKG